MSKQTGLIVLLTAVIAFSLGAASPQTEDAERLEALHQKRVELLTLVAMAHRTLHTDGQLSFSKLTETECVLIEAKISAAKTKEQKLALLQQKLDMRKELEQLVKGRYSAGIVSPTELHKTLVTTLDAEIELLTMKMQ